MYAILHTEVQQHLLIFLFSTADAVSGLLNAQAAFTHKERAHSDKRIGGTADPGAGVGPLDRRNRHVLSLQLNES